MLGLTGYRVSGGEYENVLEVNGGWQYNRANVLRATELPLKNDENGKCAVMYIFPQEKEKRQKIA